ncbi:VOC family protein [Endozoicomonas arenosclerae]|uniref:VOC family protein n=1 Tax=Endozoicomonas arenosclerae TaxID=1633495 RepID=UPI0007865633|nr:VOC family protein [Endozoicomonas arenosclerae]
MTYHEKISYVEFPSKDLKVTQKFFTEVFGWTFESYGPDYVAIHNAGLDGGFYTSNHVCSSDNGSALVVLYSQKLEETQAKIEAAGGKIIQPTFAFPGGRRFHFADPNGNEYAVWTDMGA